LAMEHGGETVASSTVMKTVVRCRKVPVVICQTRRDHK
jgi:hypothetical protein